MRLGVSSGVRAFFGGCGFVLATPRVWPYAVVPALVAFVLGAGLGALGVWGAWRAAEAVLAGPSAWAEAGRWVLALVLGAAALVASLLLAVSLAQPLSGRAIEAIVRRQERALGEAAEWPTEPLGTQVLRSLGVNLTALALGLPLIALLVGVELLAPPAALVTVPLKFVVSALMVAWDFLDYPLGARGASVRARLGFVGRHFGAVLAFGALGALVLLVPGLGLLLLPMGAAGATRLVVASESPRSGAAPEGARPGAGAPPLTGGAR